jgi:CO/xanthine dehydrogenase Mo-binding subunit
MVVKMQASLDTDGDVVDWNHDVWSYPHSSRPAPDSKSSGLVAAWHLKEPFEKAKRQAMHGSHVGSHRNADPLYSFQRKRVVKHHVSDSPLRSSTMRGLGAYANVFSIESFMDELAHAAGMDPFAFRHRYLQDERARAVLQAAVDKAGPHPREVGGDDCGRGIAFAQYKNRQCYAAVVVDLCINRDTGEIKLVRGIIAADAGQIINPDGLSNQLEGGFVQAASWTLKEQVQFDEGGILSVDWDSYPILRFSEAPKINTVLINRPDFPPLGSGEAAIGPTPAAIANAVFDATGVRLREIPFTPERVLAILD